MHRQEETSAIESDTPAPRFHDFPLSPVLLAALDAAGYSSPTPIQAGLLPRALAGVDVLGQARTGTGKTASYVVPVLQRLQPSTEKVPLAQTLILVPTRELAVQVLEEVTKLSQGMTCRAVALYGGKPVRTQITKLKRGADVVIGTPGRLLDHIGRKTLILSNLSTIVLDEADRMLDIGFRPDIERILRQSPSDRQTLLLSATVPPAVEHISKRYMRNPEMLNFSPTDISSETIEQFYLTVDGDRKFDALFHLLQKESPTQAIVFCRTKRGTDKVHFKLTKKLEGVACIHGDLPQKARDRVMARFREGKVRYLVATDVIGRGIDVSSISHIVNYDIPEFCDDYVHRVGRTGRMGRDGVAYTFVTPEEGEELTRIEMRIDRLLQQYQLEGFETFAKKPSPADAAIAEPGDAPAKPTPPPPPFSRRPTRRTRRAL